MDAEEMRDLEDRVGAMNLDEAMIGVPHGGDALAEMSPPAAAGSLQVRHERADFVVRAAGDPRGVQRGDLRGVPADRTRAEADGFRPEPLRHPQVDGGARVAGLGFDLLTAQD